MMKTLVIAIKGRKKGIPMKKLFSLALVLMMMPNAMAFAVAPTYIPGTYEAEAVGFGGPIVVTVTVNENEITDVTILGDNETPGVGGVAVATLGDAILKAQTTNVDGVTGASISSTAILTAATDALDAASADAPTQAASHSNPSMVETLDNTEEMPIIEWSSKGEEIPEESSTQVRLYDTNVLYDGSVFWKVQKKDDKTFSMGSKTYNEGFMLGCDYSLFGDGDGYALFDLQGKYSYIIFDVGRTNQYEKQDVSLQIFLDEQLSEEYPLSAQVPPKTMTIAVNHANSMKIQITGGNRVIYGFANVYLVP